MASTSKSQNNKLNKAQSVTTNITGLDTINLSVNKLSKNSLKKTAMVRKTTKTLKNKKNSFNLSLRSIKDIPINITKTRSTRSSNVELLSSDNDNDKKKRNKNMDKCHKNVDNALNTSIDQLQFKSTSGEGQNAKLLFKSRNRNNSDQGIPNKSTFLKITKDFNKAVGKAHSSKNIISNDVKSSTSIHDISPNESNVVGSLTTNKFIKQSESSSILNYKSSNVTKKNIILETTADTKLDLCSSKSVKMSNKTKKNIKKKTIGSSQSLPFTKRHLRSSINKTRSGVTRKAKINVSDGISANCHTNMSFSGSAITGNKLSIERDSKPIVKSTNKHTCSIKHEKNSPAIEKHTDKAKPVIKKSKNSLTNSKSTVKSTNKLTLSIENKKNSPDIDKNINKTKPVIKKSKKLPLPTMIYSTRSNTQISGYNIRMFHDKNKPLSSIKTKAHKVDKIIQTKKSKSSQPEYKSMDKKNESSEKPQFGNTYKASEKQERKKEFKRKGVVKIDHTTSLLPTKCIQKEKTVKSCKRTPRGIKRASDLPISEDIQKRSKRDCTQN